MKGIFLRSVRQSVASLGSALVKPAHISGVGLCLCLVLALATPSGGVHRANASRVAFSGPLAPIEQGSGWTRLGAEGERAALDMSRMVEALGNSQRLVGYFEEMGYRLDLLRDGQGTVPRLYLASLPNDLPDLQSPEIRKAVFIKAMLPTILRANEEILDRRAAIEALARKLATGRELSGAERGWLEEMSRLYDLKQLDTTELLRRVDVVPPSLALAQAALESGWGTSRFAQKGNALFGQKIFVDSPAAMPSYDRDGKEVFRMRSFENVSASVRSYMHNLNSHWAYSDFRKLRADLRRKAPTGRHDLGPAAADALAKTLLAYSERGGDYVADVRQLLQMNDLRAYDRARLTSGQLAGEVRPGA